MKVLVDEMYDGMDDDLGKIGYDAYSIKKLAREEPKFGSDYFAVGHAKENGMVVVTADTGMAKDCLAAEVRCILIDKEKLLSVIKRELDGHAGTELGQS